MYYYFIVDCRCCRQRKYIPCSQQEYKYVKGCIKDGSKEVPKFHDIIFHECMGGIGVMMVIQIIESEEEIK